MGVPDPGRQREGFSPMERQEECWEHGLAKDEGEGREVVSSSHYVLDAVLCRDSLC